MSFQTPCAHKVVWDLLLHVVPPVYWGKLLCPLGKLATMKAHERKDAEKTRSIINVIPACVSNYVQINARSSCLVVYSLEEVGSRHEG